MIKKSLCIGLLVTFLPAFSSILTANDTRIEQAQKLSWEGKYDEAILEYDSILSKDKNNLEALDNKADVLSWKGQNDQAVTLYDKYLSQKFDTKVARKKARVLAWAQDFRASIDAYNDAYNRTNDEGARLEGLAKKAWWDNQILTAIDNYKELIKLEPDNIEARSDLAQIDAYSYLPEQAVENYEYITTKYNWHFRAQEGLEKTNIVYNKVSVEPDLMWFSATSGDRYTYIRRLYSEVMFRVPVKRHYDLLFGYNLDDFRYPNSSIVRHYGVFGLEANLNARVWLSAIYGATAYTSNNIFSQKYKAKIGFRPFEPVIVTLFSQRDDLINSKTVLLMGLHSTDVGANIRINEHRVTATTLEYRRSFINDTNRENYLSFEQQLFVLKAPTELTLISGVNFQDWRTVMTDYFSPQHFWSVPTTLRWRHYLNKNDLYYGARDTYYGVRYRFQVDKGTTIFNGGGIELHHDFTNKLGVHYEVFGNYSNVYKDFGMYLSLVGYFL